MPSWSLVGNVQVVPPTLISAQSIAADGLTLRHTSRSKIAPSRESRMPPGWNRPSAALQIRPPMKPPRREPAIPSRSVANQPIGSLPGKIRRARAPTTIPRIIHHKTWNIFFALSKVTARLPSWALDVKARSLDLAVAPGLQLVAPSATNRSLSQIVYSVGFSQGVAVYIPLALGGLAETVMLFVTFFAPHLLAMLVAAPLLPASFATPVKVATPWLNKMYIETQDSDLGNLAQWVTTFGRSLSLFTHEFTWATDGTCATSRL